MSTVDQLEERMYYAIQVDEYICLGRLIQEGMDINTMFSGMVCVTGRPHRWSALHLCCENGSYNCAKVLLDAGADPDPQDKWNITPLMYCVQTEWPNILELLIQKGAGVNIQDRKGRTALHFAIENSTIQCTEMLLRADADPNIGDMLACTPLWTAAANDGHLEFIQTLLDQANCSLNRQDVREQRTPLQAAIMHSNKDKLKYMDVLLAKGASVNIRDARNHTSVMCAMYRNWNDGCDISDEDIHIIRLLLKHGYDINDVPETRNWMTYGGTVLNMAVERGALGLISLLLDTGADPDITDKHDVGPLLLAASCNRVGAAALLIGRNCDLNKVGFLRVSRHGRQRLTPLQCAVSRGYWEFISLLYDAGIRLTSLKFLWTNANVPDSLVENCDLWLWLREAACNVKPLMLLVRDEIRRHLSGTGLVDKLQQMDIPVYLQNILCLTSVVQQYTDNR